MSIESDDTIREILERKTIAVVGCSSSPGKAAHDVPKYLLERGYDIIPVNPFAEEIFDRRAYDSLSEIGDDVAVDIVCVFRPSEEVSEIVADVLEAELDADVFWTQLGIRDDEAAARAEEAGMDVVQDRCLKVEHRRLMG